MKVAGTTIATLRNMDSAGFGGRICVPAANVAVVTAKSVARDIVTSETKRSRRNQAPFACIPVRFMAAGCIEAFTGVDPWFDSDISLQSRHHPNVTVCWRLLFITKGMQ